MNMNIEDTGWIKLYRKSLSNGWLKNHKLWVFWCYCLLKASHKEHKTMIGNQQVVLQPGQFIFGRKKASEETGLSEQQIRTSITSLRTLENLTIQSTNKYSLVTVVNWAFYQGSEEETTNKQPASNQQVTTNKNVRMKEIYKERFDSFWKEYPSRNGKKLEREETKRRFSLLKEEDLSLVVTAAKNYSQSKMVLEGVGIKDPKRFLKDGKGNEYWREWIEPEVKPRRYDEE